MQNRVKLRILCISAPQNLPGRGRGRGIYKGHMHLNRQNRTCAVLKPQADCLKQRAKIPENQLKTSSHSLLCFAAGYPGGILDDASFLPLAAHIMMLTLFISILRLSVHLGYSTWVAKELKGSKSGSRGRKHDLFLQQRDRLKELGDACFCSGPCSDSQVVLAPYKRSPLVSGLQATLTSTDSNLSATKQVCCSLMHYCMLHALKCSDKCWTDIYR